MTYLQINADATVQRRLPDCCKQVKDASTQNEEGVRRRTDRETQRVKLLRAKSRRRLAPQVSSGLKTSGGSARAMRAMKDGRCLKDAPIDPPTPCDERL